MELDTVIVEGKTYVPASALARARNTSRNTIYMAVADGRLKGEHIVGRLLIPLADAEAFEVQQRGGNRGGGRKKKATE